MELLELLEEEYELTNDIHEAIWIFDNEHIMISGEFEMGIRGTDHNNLLGLAPDDLPTAEQYEYLHIELGAIRLVPETMIALIDIEQSIERHTREFIENAGYTIERY